MALNNVQKGLILLLIGLVAVYVVMGTNVFGKGGITEQKYGVSCNVKLINPPFKGIMFNYLGLKFEKMQCSYTKVSVLSCISIPGFSITQDGGILLMEIDGRTEPKSVSVYEDVLTPINFGQSNILTVGCVEAGQNTVKMTIKDEKGNILDQTTKEIFIEG